jgi:antitoxin (DNA-binding transcriptional repressor) of toxin-antitoxin stability system
MDRTINAKELRASLPKIVERVRRGERFTVIYRSRAALRLVPVSDDARGTVPLEDDPLYRAKAVGSSADGLSSRDHDQLLYGR